MGIKNTFGINQRVWIVGIPSTIMYVLFAIGFALFRYLEPMGKVPLLIGKIIYGVPFIVLNFIFNLIFGSFIFMEFPKEMQFTNKVARHKLSSDQEVKDVAFMICAQMNKHDPNHC